MISSLGQEVIQESATDRSQIHKTTTTLIIKYAIKHLTTAKENPPTTRLAPDWVSDNRIVMYSPAYTRFNTTESEGVTTAVTIQIQVMGASTSKKLTLAIAISHGIKEVLAHRVVITIRLLRETV